MFDWTKFDQYIARDIQWVRNDQTFHVINEEHWVTQRLDFYKVEMPIADNTNSCDWVKLSPNMGTTENGMGACRALNYNISI